MEKISERSKRLKEFNAIFEDKLNKYDCEAESWGMLITNYKLYEMKRRNQIIKDTLMALLTAGIYFLVGLFSGMLLMTRIIFGI